MTAGGAIIVIFVASLPLTMFQVGGLGSGQRLITVSLIGWALWVLLTTRAKISLRRGAGFWWAYAVWTILSVTWVSDFREGLTIGTGLALLILALLLMACLPVTRADLRRVEFAWLLMAGVCVLLFLILGKQATYGQRTELDIAAGGSDPNEFSAYFLMPLAYMAHAALASRGIARLGAVLGAGVMVYVVLMTGSRAGLMACILVLAISASRRAWGSLSGVLWVGVLAVVGTYLLTAYLLPLIPPAVLERLSIDALMKDRGSGREDIWVAAMDVLAKGDWHLFFGFGPYGAPLDRPVFHNHFVQAFMDGGLVGLVLFLGVVVTALGGAWRNPRVFAGVAGVSLMLVTLTGYSNFRHAWAILFMSLLVRRNGEAGEEQRGFHSSRRAGLGHYRSRRAPSS